MAVDLFNNINPVKIFVSKPTIRIITLFSRKFLIAVVMVISMVIDRVYEVYTFQLGSDFKLCQAWF
jgi:hypothetical protein